MSVSQVLTVLALLVGLVAMHGLSSHHDMCSGHGLTTTAAGGAADHHQAGATATAVPTHSTHELAPARVAVPAVVQVVVPAVARVAVQVPVEVCGHGGATCVAVLTMLLLLMPLLRGGRRRAPAGGDRAVTAGASWRGRGPPLSRAPSLFVLCQLRN